MKKEYPCNSESELSIFSGEGFSGWTSLNDSIMGGSSSAGCTLLSQGLLLKGKLIEEGGGFVSCRSELFKPALNLSQFRSFQLEVDGEGRNLKFAVGCRNSFFGLTEMFYGGLRWIFTFPTKEIGTTKVQIPFDSLEATISAKAVKLPVSFDPSSITQFQLLHSKFGQAGQLNPGFRSGPIQLLLRSISAIS